MTNAQKIYDIKWENIAEFSDFPENLGLAGMAVAKVSDGFIIAGGANFPDALPWEGGKKHFSDKIFFWDGKSKHPEALNIKLPTPLAYSGYTSFNDQLIIIGGETYEGASKKIYSVSKKEVREWADLPEGVIAPAITKINQQLFIIGGDTASKTLNQFITIDLNNDKKDCKILPNLPISTANSAIFTIKNKIFVASGRSKNPNGISTLNTEIFTFNLNGKNWEKETDITIDGEISPFVASAFFTYKDRFLVFAGGDDGKVFNKIETYLNKMANSTDEKQKETLTREKNYLVKHHQGFNNKIFAYDTQTKQWINSSRLPFTANVTTASLFDQEKFYIFSGEIRPGIRSPKIWVGTLK